MHRFLLHGSVKLVGPMWMVRGEQGDTAGREGLQQLVRALQVGPHRLGVGQQGRELCRPGGPFDAGQHLFPGVALEGFVGKKMVDQAACRHPADAFDIQQRQ